jgi:immunity protein 50 of polymorphic toxin system
MKIIDREILVGRFGRWPAFHDAEVYAVRMDSGRRSDGQIRLEIDVHLFRGTREEATGELVYVDHTLATLEFLGAEDIELGGFNSQNVLFDLLLEPVQTTTGDRIRVLLQSSFGLGGGFSCSQVRVVAAVDFTPGDLSPYGAP